MSRRRKYDWPSLFQEFKDSGLTQAKFCDEKDINPNYFSLRYTKHQRAQPDSFSRVEVSQVAPSNSGIVLRLSHGELHFDSNTEPEYIASIIRAL